MDHKAQLRFVENIDNFMGFFNNILLEEFVDYSLIFMRSHNNVTSWILMSSPQILLVKYC